MRSRTNGNSTSRSFLVCSAPFPSKTRAKTCWVDLFSNGFYLETNKYCKTLTNGIKPLLVPNTPSSGATSGVWNRSRIWATIFIRPSRGEIVARPLLQCSLEQQAETRLCMYGRRTRCTSNHPDGIVVAVGCLPPAPGIDKPAPKNLFYRTHPEDWPFFQKLSTSVRETARCATTRMSTRSAGSSQR